MYKLNRQLAQNIVDSLMQDIPYNINIMDKNGIIIGSGNKDRIGTLHKGAARAIKEWKVVDIPEDQLYEKKGTNLPIEINGEILGVVGISGEVEHVKPFGNLIKSTTILLIEQGIALKKEQRAKNRKDEFFRLLIDPETEITDEIINQAKTYNIDLNKESIFLYIELPYELNSELTLQYYYSTFQVSDHLICSVIQDSKNKEALKNYLESNLIDAHIAISKTNDSIAEGFRQAKAAMRVLKGIFPLKKWISYESVEFMADICDMQVSQKNTLDQYSLPEVEEELIKTLQVYINCNLNINETAEHLNIHRNTLNYRLDRIHKLTEKDPKYILDLFELIYTLIKNPNTSAR